MSTTRAATEPAVIIVGASSAWEASVIGMCRSRDLPVERASPKEAIGVLLERLTIGMRMIFAADDLTLADLDLIRAAGKDGLIVIVVLEKPRGDQLSARLAKIAMLEHLGAAVILDPSEFHRVLERELDTLARHGGGWPGGD